MIAIVDRFWDLLIMKTDGRQEMEKTVVVNGLSWLSEINNNNNLKTMRTMTTFSAFALQDFPKVFSETKKTTGLPETGLVRVITTVS